MHFTQALTVALSLSAAAVKAAPVRSSQENSSKLMLRSVPDSQIVARDVGSTGAVSSMPLQARGLDSVSHFRRAIDVRFGDLDPHARDLAMVTELHRRGLLDQLVAALRDLIITLLGKGGGMSRRQASTTQLEQAIHQVTCILDALFGNTDDTCSDVLGGSSNSTNATNATSATSATGKAKSPLEKKLAALGSELRNGTSITQVVDGLMFPNATAPADKKSGKKAGNKKGDKGKHADGVASADNATSATDPATGAATSATTTAQQEKRSYELLQARQNSGVEGLLVALRDVVDTILNTLLPMASRGEDESSASSTSSGQWPPQDCPPPTPNDGMYRPGCPGYGKRDLALRRSMDALGERDANVLQSIMPMIQMLLQQLPSLIQSMASSPTSSAASSAATAASATGSAKNASPTSMVDDAFAQIMSAMGYNDSAATGKSGSSSNKASSATSTGAAAKAQATGAASIADADSAARSAANLSKNFARDLLNGDGMNLGKRQTTSGTDNNGTIGSDNCDASGNSGGINVSLLNNLLNGLLSGFSRRSEEYVPLEFFKRQTTSTDDGDDGIGSGNCSSSNNSGGVNVSLLDNLLNGLLSGFSRRDVPAEGMVSVEALQRDVMTGEPHVAARSASESAVFQERADFAPVWAQIKKLGNEHFHAARDVTDNESAVKRAAAAASNDDAPNFTPVWEALRDLVDSGYEQAAKGAQRRDAAPLKLDYKPLMKAGIKFGKQVFKSYTTHHAKRSTDYKPFIDAASNFAATAVKEMFVKSS